MAFGLRLPWVHFAFMYFTANTLRIIVPTILRLYYLHIQFSSTNPTLDGVIATVCTQIQLSYAVIAVTTPCLRPFISALSTNYGAPARSKASPAGTGASGSSNGYSLKYLPKKSNLGPREGEQQTSVPTTRWDGNEHHVTIMSGDNHSIGSHESKQMIIAKNTEWAVEYTEASQGSTRSGRVL